MLVEASLSFVAARALQVSFGLGTAMGKPARRGLLFGLAPLGPLALDPKINDGAHGKSSEKLGKGSGNKHYAGTVSLDHSRSVLAPNPWTRSRYRQVTAELTFS